MQFCLVLLRQLTVLILIQQLGLSQIIIEKDSATELQVVESML